MGPAPSLGSCVVWRLPPRPFSLVRACAVSSEPQRKPSFHGHVASNFRGDRGSPRGSALAAARRHERVRARRRVAGGGTRGTRARRSIASVHRRPIARETRGAGRSSRGARPMPCVVVRRRRVDPVPRRGDLHVIPILALVVHARPRLPAGPIVAVLLLRDARARHRRRRPSRRHEREGVVPPKLPRRRRIRRG